MKAPISSLLAATLLLGFVTPAMAQDQVDETQPGTVTETTVTTKHEHDKEHGYDELFKENGGDLDREHWANEAIQNLIEKYCGIMVGYPDNTFRGQRQMTRYEMGAALYKLMQCLDVQVRTIEVPQVDTSHLATKEDLAKVAALQQELGDELQQIMAGHLELEARISEEEKITVHGGIQMRYRDRVWVTDGTDRNSPLFAVNNSSPEQRVGEGGVVSARQPNEPNPLAFSNNINQFVRDEYGLPDQYHSPATPNVTIDDLTPFRPRTWLSVEAKPYDWVSAEVQLDLFDIGRASSGLSGVYIISNGGHDVNEGLPDGASFVFRKAAINLHSPDKGSQLQAGLFNFGTLLNPGTGFTSLFDQGAWNGRDYGFVGWGGADIALSNTAVTPYRNSLSRYWSGGLNASMVDPDSKRYNQATSPALAWRSDWGTGNFLLGFNAGSVQTNRLMAANGNLASGGPAVQPGQFTSAGLWSGAVLQGRDRKGVLTGNHLALPSQYGDGYGVIGLEQRFLEDAFPIRVSLAGMHYFNDALLDFSSATRKEISGTVDLGWNKGFGASLQVNKSFIGYDRHVLGLFFNDLGGSGFDLQLAGNIATRGLFNLSDMATASAGLALGIPVYHGATGSDQVKVIIGARQSFADNFGGSTDQGALNQLYKDSGFTISVPWKSVFGTHLELQAQYGLLMADALWAGRPVAQDLVLIGTYTF